MERDEPLPPEVARDDNAMSDNADDVEADDVGSLKALEMLSVWDINVGENVITQDRIKGDD